MKAPAGALARALPWLAGAGVVVVAALLVALVFLDVATPFSASFLAGVLTAASLALASGRSASGRSPLRLGREVATESEAEMRARAENALAAAREGVRYLDELMPAMIAYVNPRHHVVFHNRACGRWLGAAEGGLQGRTLGDALAPGAYAAMEARLDEALRGRLVRYDAAPRMADGVSRRMGINFMPHFGPNGEVSGVFAILLPIADEDDIDISVDGSQPGVARGAEHSVYADAMARALTPWRDVAHRLASALERDEFILFSQPIVALAAAAPTPFFEVLLRLQEEEENLMPPGAFLPLAEKHGLMPDIDQWVVRRLLKWADGDPARCGSIVSINVAGTSMCDPGFVDFVREALLARPGRGPVLCFEFGEGEAMLDLSATAAFMQELKPAGCRFALSGLTGDPVSFKLLRRLRVDYIKIDGGIVVNMSRNPVDAAKVRAITQAAHATGAMAIAQCVEDDATLGALRSMDVDFAQGFGIARPAALEPAPPRERA